VDPASLDAYGMLGQMYYEQGRLAEGRREFETLVARQPRAVAAHTMLAIILRREGRIDDAIARYEHTLGIDPNAPVAANNLAWLLAEQGRDLQRALNLARTARRYLPDRPEVSDTLGWLYHLTGASDLATAELQDTVRSAPDNPLFRYHLGAAFAKAGDAARARQALTEALRLSSTFPGADEARRLLASLESGG
jgi:predicted Zn-dependent protease